MLNDYDALVDWIVSEIGPKTVLAVGIGQAPLISALGARECEVFAIEAAIEPIEKRYDIIVCLGPGTGAYRSKSYIRVETRGTHSQDS